MKSILFAAIFLLLAAVANAHGQSINASLSWADNSTDETGFKIERAPDPAGPFSPLGTTIADITTYTDTGLSPKTQYCYRVWAFNQLGDSPAPTNVACIGTPGVPNVPGNLVVIIVIPPAPVNATVK